MLFTSFLSILMGDNVKNLLDKTIDWQSSNHISPWIIASPALSAEGLGSLVGREEKDLRMPGCVCLCVWWGCEGVLGETNELDSANWSSELPSPVWYVIPRTWTNARLPFLQVQCRPETWIRKSFRRTQKERTVPRAGADGKWAIPV